MYNAKNLLAKVRKNFLPSEKLKVSEWAAENITVSSGNSSGMKYDPNFMPYQNEIMDAVVDPTIDKICVVAAARIGKTFCVRNIMAYFMVHEPTSILYMRPADTDIIKFSKEEMASLIMDTPSLREKIDNKVETYDHKIFPGGSLRLIGSNSPGKLKGYGVKIALLDEIDTYTAIPGFGSPCDLAEERTAEYALFGRKIIYISTPTVMDEENKIDWLYENKSDKRVYLVPCIHCQVEQELNFHNIKFDHCRDNLSEAFYECEHCKGHINDSQRLTMMRKGRWVATKPEIKGFAGFKINRLYSPLATMESLCRDFLNKKDNFLMLRQFLNDALAIAWDEHREVKSSTNELFQRREHYLAPIPHGVAFLTMSTDIQGNKDTEKCWLEYEVKGWGRDNENWTIEHGLLYGNPAEKDIWNQLQTKINQTYTTWAGEAMGITVCGIDTQGGFTKEVQEFIRHKPRILGLEGKKNNLSAPLISKRKNVKINSWEVGTNTAKDTIFSILPVKQPGPNCCHFPDTLDEEYFLSLLSEKKVEKIVGGIKTKKYHQTRNRNEVLDLFVMNWYLYNHVKKFKPSLLEDSLKRQEGLLQVDHVETPETPKQQLSTVQQQSETPIEKSIEPVKQVQKRTPYRMPVMNPNQGWKF